MYDIMPTWLVWSYHPVADLLRGGAGGGGGPPLILAKKKK